MSEVITAELNTNAPTPSPAPVQKRRRSVVAPDPFALIRQLIWLYLILWLIEGGLRRWFLPGLATPLLLIRDPLVFLIYGVAIAKNVFPTNGFVIAGAVLGGLSFVCALAVGHGNPMVALYGLHCDFLHVPLIFIMARVLRRDELLSLCRIAVWLVVPYTLLLVAQFNSPQDAWVNRGVGGSLEGAGFAGALDRFRPPGTFSFITGTAQLYTIFTACWFVLVLARKIPAWLMVASGVAILVAVPVSVSRGLFFSVLIVAIIGVAALFIGGRMSGSVLFRVVVAAILLPVLAGRIGAFKDGMEAFGSRWDATIEAGDGIQGAVVDRVVGGFTEPFQNVSFLGQGTGYSSNVGQKLLTDEKGFGSSEGEWGRLLYDNGIFLGGSLVVYRSVLAGAILLAAFRAWQRRSPYSLIFASAASMPVLAGQWGQASSLGGSIIEAGLALAAAEWFGVEIKKRVRRSEAGLRNTVADGNEAPFAVSAQPKIKDIPD